MNQVGFRLITILCLFTLSALCLFAGPNSSDIKPDKITPRELIENHLKSIGSTKEVKALKSILIVGTTKAVFKGRGAGLADGVAVLASEGNKNMIGMRFSHPDYVFETMGYDGENFSVGYARPGVRTVLGGFLQVNEKTFKSGLMGGALSASWELRNYDEKTGKLKYSGSTRDGEMDLHKFDYNLRKGSDLDVSMYFDAATFRHIKTEYTRVITSGLGRAAGNNVGVATSRIDNSARQSETRYTMVEKFGDFADESGFTLPHSYDIYLEIETGNGNTMDHWSLVLQKFSFNEEIDDAGFRVDSSE